MEKKDILSRADIELLVNRFYDKVKEDAILGYLFNDVAKTNWQVHLPKMYDFWKLFSLQKVRLRAILCWFTGSFTKKVC